MSLPRPRGFAAWLYHRLVANYWSLPVLAVLASPLAALLLVRADREGATAWLLERDLASVATADTARDLAGVVAGIDTALLALYVSISLLVLTIAASNLGVRLIDRWLSKPLVRISLAGLSFSIIYALVLMAAIDADADLDDTPLLAFTAMLGLQLVNLAMLAVALHDLGRTMFVDRSIAKIGEDAAVCDLPLVGRANVGWQAAETLRAGQSGYVEGHDLTRLAEILDGHQGRLRLAAAPGSFVMTGDPLIEFEQAGAPLEQIERRLAIGPFRSDAQGPVFQIRLLVEIAARALSPAVNDFYSAIACADRLCTALAGQTERWVADDTMPVWRHDERFELPGQHFRGLFGAPLAALRQAACDYPSVTIRMIGNLGKLAARVEEADLADYLRSEAEAFAAHAIARSGFDRDKADIAEALARISAAGGQAPN